ncbi:MFS transporter [Proteus hauseri]|uniref:MFS transporter n=1 Tax=Proteus hauseri TaxID=183417 RepID=UPI0010097077|nr:MFS transporter [Proteus hauseri]QAV24627.1 MFS transporter [Proteus hauseri]
MIKTYKKLFSHQGTVLFTLAGLVARLPLPMMGIGIIMMISQTQESYALAGAISACFVFTYAILSPQISRLVDSYGQGNVLPIFSLISVLGTGLMLFISWLQWHISLFFVAAVLMGFMPCISAMIRARWTAIYKKNIQLQTAYSLETVLDEVTFIIGPPIAVALSVAFFPQAGILIATILLSIGVFLLSIQRKSEPTVEKNMDIISSEKNKSVIHYPLVKILALIMVFMGIIVGTIDIFSVAFADLQGNPATASIVLSAYAVSSCISGLVFGAVKLSSSLPRLLFVGGIATFITTLPLAIIASVYSLSGVVFISGIFFAPMIIVTMSLIEKAVPEKQLTEGMTWLLAGLNIGVAIGAALTGQVVDYFGTNSGSWVAISASMLVMLTAFIGYRRANSVKNIST